MCNRAEKALAAVRGKSGTKANYSWPMSWSLMMDGSRYDQRATGPQLQRFKTSGSGVSIACFQTVRLVIEMMVAEDEWVAARWRIHGTHQGSRKAITDYTAQNMWRVRTENWWKSATTRLICSVPPTCLIPHVRINGSRLAVASSPTWRCNRSAQASPDEANRLSLGLRHSEAQERAGA